MALSKDDLNQIAQLMKTNNDAQFEDLKQYIDGRLSQTETALRSEINQVEQKLDNFREEVNERFEDVDTKLDTIMDATGEQMSDHERRITKLESQTA
jgi:hypothetical protein